MKHNIDPNVKRNQRKEITRRIAYERYPYAIRSINLEFIEFIYV